MCRLQFILHLKWILSTCKRSLKMTGVMGTGACKILGGERVKLAGGQSVELFAFNLLHVAIPH